MKCALCKKEVYLPYLCNYCGQYFCDDHRLPEHHMCPGLPKRSWASWKNMQLRPRKQMSKIDGKKFQKVTSRKSRSIKGKIILLLVIIGIASIIYIQYKPSAYNLQKYTEKIGEAIEKGYQALKGATEKTGKQVNETLENLYPEPPTQEELIQFALDEINKERTKHGLSNVTLSPITCGQSHADDMLQNKYLSHWGTDGLKPYMRYTRTGGRGSVSENCAWYSSTGVIDPYEAIENLNWNMVYDDADSNWGHRDNLIDPLHNRVSIGVAWNDYNLFLVQDFEDYYFLKAEITQTGNIIELYYTFTEDNWNPNQIAIYYDTLPVPLSVETLNSPLYSSSYGLGSFVGAVLPEGYYIEAGITINAMVWSQNEEEFKARFDLSEVFNKGEGVYTIVIWESNKIWTTYSIWH